MREWDGAASGRRMTARRKNLAAGREGRLLINAGAEASRGARSRALALRGGWLSAAGSWPADKGSAAEDERGERDMEQGSARGWLSHPSHALGDTRWNGESITAHSSVPLQYPKSILYPCTQTSVKVKAHSLEQVANFYQLC